MDSPVARILRKALAESDKRGVRRPRITDLSADEVHTLSAATLQFLRTRPSQPSSWPGWVEVGSFEVGVNRWWNAEIEEPFPSDISKRLQTLRGDIYDHLEDEQGLIVKGRGQKSPIHLSPTARLPGSRPQGLAACTTVRLLVLPCRTASSPSLGGRRVVATDPCVRCRGWVHARGRNER